MSYTNKSSSTAGSISSYMRPIPSTSPQSHSSHNHLQPNNTSSSSAGSTHSRPEIHRLSGNFNTPTEIELEQTKKNKSSLSIRKMGRGFKDLFTG
ncbi:hypothetical protein P280DRAFT_466253 [Massarina eburnea CBS 473.64]|uniref:Uncharacterized protein n=1 Tax=Massarina eburnea CBS 473.64 TaxID=1395130 RepID=A0A6A6SCK2_9PLEO|nr:hypothetical protein P280DRAFT_466253 [Massarina eburnea CBS 473.64]